MSATTKKYFCLFYFFTDFFVRFQFSFQRFMWLVSLGFGSHKFVLLNGIIFKSRKYGWFVKVITNWLMIISMCCFIRCEASILLIASCWRNTVQMVPLSHWSTGFFKIIRVLLNIKGTILPLSPLQIFRDQANKCIFSSVSSFTRADAIIILDCWARDNLIPFFECCFGLIFSPSPLFFWFGTSQEVLLPAWTGLISVLTL